MTRSSLLWALVSAAALAACGAKSAPGTGTASTGGTTAPAATAAAGYYCPMHPEVTSDKPADCPKCGMHLEPKKP